MSENCPYYTLPGGKKGGAIVIGSFHCLAGNHPMCGSHDVCPDSVAKKPEAADLSEEPAESNDRLDWSTVDLDESGAEDVGALPVEAEPTKLVSAVIKGETLGEALYRLRTEKGFTMVTLAKASGVLSPSISKWEAGKMKPGLDSLMKLDQALGSDLAKHFGDGTKPKARLDHRRKKPSAALAEIKPPARIPPAIESNRGPSGRSVPVSPAPIGPVVDGTRDDFLREILREAAQARKDFNYFLHTALEAVRKLPE